MANLQDFPKVFLGQKPFYASSVGPSTFVPLLPSEQSQGSIGDVSNGLQNGPVKIKCSYQSLLVDLLNLCPFQKLMTQDLEFYLQRHAISVEEQPLLDNDLNNIQHVEFQSGYILPGFYDGGLY